MARLSVIVLLLVSVFAKLREGDCEVCLSVVERFITDAKGIKKQDDIEESIRKSCAGMSDRDQRMCYYIGGTPDAATGMLRSLSGPMKNGMPASRICEKLKKMDAQVCELRYTKAIDVDTMDLKKSRVKVLSPPPLLHYLHPLPPELIA
jgi:hypothetical protein